ncbi:hypothetical protein H6F67_05195 [Microcoleus sp. FACHB-1515]|uniref:hypothetical protein n=1 Tax=Cyanophyceae TaxID=3028117 RepID=UPI0016893308|nr:hypothetical protein [Microcoleus sp. FACHB-1515]MBD2089245.1 hypothetical protein [Microcoleus sp. FACHB-1515]
MKRARYKVTSLSDRYAFIQLSDRIGLVTQALKRSGKGGRRARVISAYFGFATEAEATDFIAGFRRYFPKAFCQVRQSQRLATAFEVKVRDFPALEKFVWTLAAKPEIVTPQQAKADISPVEPAAPATNVIQFDRSNAPVMHRSTRPLAVHGLAIE